ncbi:MAG: hypothetical protein HC930_10005 [Hydrococcus sp. SU_1_0]|nr:hypothetical protein [Hydrococcus sp. SU_1_0]
MKRTLLLNNLVYFPTFFLLSLQPINAKEISTFAFSTNKIPRSRATELPKTNSNDWLTQQTPINKTIQIADVNLKQTATGLEVILATPVGKLSQPITSSTGNSLVTEINNARLALPNQPEFRAEILQQILL